jgi:electron transfer flavoprotein alpha subunit
MADDYKGIWVFSEMPQLTFELLGGGRTLANELGTELVAISLGQSADSQGFIQQGADKVFSIVDPLVNTFHVDTYTDVLTALVNEHRPDVILIGATRNGLDFAPRLAERLKTGCVTEATRLEVDAEKKFVLMERVAYGGNVVETQISKSKPQIATVPRGLYSALPADASRKGEVVMVEPKISGPNTKLLEIKPKEARGVRLADASVIVSFGRGVRKKEDVAVIEEFAKTVGGAVGCSRPIAEDLRWLPEEQYIGLSGQKVSPKLYFACGISGQIQHLTGIRNSRIIVAINNDPKAPIFEFCDYGIVGDLYQVIPSLTEALKQLSAK